MRIFFSFTSLGTLVLSLVFFYRVGGWELFAAVIMLVLSIHLEIGLRVMDSMRFTAKQIHELIEFVNRVTGN